MDFHEIWYLNVTLKSIDTFQFWWESDKSYGEGGINIVVNTTINE
jgi:hypothetical protein